MESKGKINDLRDLWPIVRKRKWLIIIPWILVSAIVIAGSFLMTPTYESYTIVLLDREVKLSSELQGLLGITRAYQTEGQRRDELQGYYNELTSSWYINQMAEKLKLYDEPELISRAMAAASKQPSVSVDQIKLHMLQNELMEKIQVRFAGGDQLMISAEHQDPARSRDIANTLGEIFINEKLKQEMASIRSSQDFSDIQLDKYEKQLQDKVEEKTTFEKNYINQQMDDNVTSESNRLEIQTEIDNTESDINDRQSGEKDLLNKLNSAPGLSTSNLALRDSELNRRTKEELKTQLQSIGDLLQKYSWSDPQVLNYRLRQNSMIKTIETEIRRLVDDQFGGYDNSVRTSLATLFFTRAELDYFYSKVTFLKASLDELKDRVNRIPEYQAKLDRLNREIVAATELRDKFKKQQESSSISQALLQDLSTSKYRVVEPAKMPLAPVKPDKLRIMLIGILMGLVLGMAAAVLVELLDTSFKKVEDLENALGLPVLGVAPRIEFMDRLKRKVA